MWPASMVEIPAISIPERIALGIDSLAVEFSRNLTDKASVSSPEEYRESFLSEAQLNDIRFKTRYGARLWHAHHVQSQHTLGPAVREGEADK
jgi:hypothetical protein